MHLMINESSCWHLANFFNVCIYNRVISLSLLTGINISLTVCALRIFVYFNSRWVLNLTEKMLHPSHAAVPGRDAHVWLLTASCWQGSREAVVGTPTVPRGGLDHTPSSGPGPTPPLGNIGGIYQWMSTSVLYVSLSPTPLVVKDDSLTVAEYLHK